MGLPAPLPTSANQCLIGNTNCLQKPWCQEDDAAPTSAPSSIILQPSSSFKSPTHGLCSRRLPASHPHTPRGAEPHRTNLQLLHVGSVLAFTCCILTSRHWLLRKKINNNNNNKATSAQQHTAPDSLSPPMPHLQTINEIFMC